MKLDKSLDWVRFEIDKLLDRKTNSLLTQSETKLRRDPFSSQTWFSSSDSASDFFSWALEFRRDVESGTDCYIAIHFRKAIGASAETVLLLMRLSHWFKFESQKKGNWPARTGAKEQGCDRIHIWNWIAWVGMKFEHFGGLVRGCIDADFYK